MGLDIHVYTNVKEVAPEVAKSILEDEYPSDAAYTAGYRIPYINPGFPGREEGVKEVPYTYDGDWHFRAGSYSGHMTFRQNLCNVLGLGDFRVWLNSNESDIHGPFEEFLYFSDCEGTIGPVVSKKLAVDFAKFEEQAKEYALELQAKGLMEMGYSEEAALKQAKKDFEAGPSMTAASFFWEKYQNWKRAFDDAGSNNGFVAFC